jgi:hypothetical protein
MSILVTSSDVITSTVSATDIETKFQIITERTTTTVATPTSYLSATATVTSTPTTVTTSYSIKSRSTITKVKTVTINVPAFQKTQQCLPPLRLPVGGVSRFPPPLRNKR